MNGGRRQGGGRNFFQYIPPAGAIKPLGFPLRCRRQMHAALKTQVCRCSSGRADAGFGALCSVGWAGHFFQQLPNEMAELGFDLLAALDNFVVAGAMHRVGAGDVGDDR